MRIIPVLDIKAGLAVHAVAGNRAHYLPVQSTLHSSPDPMALANAFRHKLGLDDLYVADLDAIAGQPPQLETLQRLLPIPRRLWLDAGFVDASTLSGFGSWPTLQVVLGLETIEGPSTIESALDLFGPSRVILSLDLHQGLPLLPPVVRPEWPVDPRDLPGLVNHAHHIGVRHFLLLDLAHVGTGNSLASWALPLLASLQPFAPAASWYAGGGLRSLDELPHLQRAGCRGVLVASLLHSGTLTRGMLSIDQP